ncbi:threonine-phosphate decarboxylase CobD [Pararhizobium sp. IMCC21322]|uniref:threonine-phosphate decarboxylase CobD n=1 Tax=Pararhizobium sp. IMCC21322 TaxID=3067903 RepID=UPI0027428973|nr:threonine-phosphate decarboxylase CobD [Pararhizobium sp. IMCC21322]
MNPGSIPGEASSFQQSRFRAKIWASAYDQSKPDMKHGGDLPYNSKADRGDWLDLSTGINPHPYSLPDLSASDWQTLPSQFGLDELLSAARRYYQVPDAIGIIAVPGTEAAISQFPDFCPGSVDIIEPTYSSHRTAWAADGRTATSLGALPAKPAENHLVVVNPNNPTGDLLAPEELLATARSLASDRFLIVDEAFMDCTPQMSIVPHMQPDLPVIVLKSFGKFFGLAGLRLGFVIGNPALLKKFSDRFGEWCISGPALKIGAAAFNDSQWQSAMRTRLGKDMAKLADMLSHRHQLVGKTDLFLTCRHRNAQGLHRFLADHKIWTRSFSYEPDWLRFGLPKTEENLVRLAQYLSAFDEPVGGS